jgi:methyl farnesoate epoxidase/farnesoate epoxidase
LIFTEGDQWLEQRRFTLRHLKDFGFGKKTMESVIQEEVSDLIERFKETAGKPISTENAFNAAILNAIWSIIAGDRFKQDDPELMKAIRLLTT